MVSGSIKKAVIKFSGDIVEDPSLLIKHIMKLRELYERGYRFVIVVGGGRYARKMLNILSALNVNNFDLDYIGILTSRLHAKLISLALKGVAYEKIPENLEDLSVLDPLNKIIVCGGLIPGQSTTTVSLELAEKYGIDTVIYLTKVDGLYDKDPEVFNDARLIKEAKIDDIFKIFFESSASPGSYKLLDIQSLKIAKRSGIKIYITNMKNVNAVEEILQGKNPGSVILP